jgi:hypothetical protein
METKNRKDTKIFDAIKVMRQIRDKLSLEIMNMSFEEERDYLDKVISEENKSKQPIPNSVQAL